MLRNVMSNACLNLTAVFTSLVLGGLGYAQAPIDLSYDSATGEMGFASGDGQVVRELQIVSSSGIFNGEPTVDLFDFFEQGLIYLAAADSAPLRSVWDRFQRRDFLTTHCWKICASWGN